MDDKDILEARIEELENQVLDLRFERDKLYNMVALLNAECEVIHEALRSENEELADVLSASINDIREANLDVF